MFCSTQINSQERGSNPEKTWPRLSCMLCKPKQARAHTHTNTIHKNKSYMHVCNRFAQNINILASTPTSRVQTRNSFRSSNLLLFGGSFLLGFQACTVVCAALSACALLGIITGINRCRRSRGRWWWGPSLACLCFASLRFALWGSVSGIFTHIMCRCLTCSCFGSLCFALWGGIIGILNGSFGTT